MEFNEEELEQILHSLKIHEQELGGKLPMDLIGRTEREIKGIQTFNKIIELIKKIENSLK